MNYLATWIPKKTKSDYGTSKTVTDRAVRNFGRKLSRKPEQISKSIFTTSKFLYVPRTSWNFILGTMASCENLWNWPPNGFEASIHPKNMVLDMSCVLFTKETGAILDEPDGRANGWVYIGDERHQRLRHQQQCRGVMLWTGIIDRTYLLAQLVCPKSLKWL